jgi:ArsR family transcriptional regulator
MTVSGIDSAAQLPILRHYDDYRNIHARSPAIVTGADRNDDLARIFRALGDPSRLAIFELVRDCCADGSPHEAADLRSSVSEIAAQFDLSLSTVSHHLKELRTAGLIRCERRGQHILCEVDPDALAVVEQFAASQVVASQVVAAGVVAAGVVASQVAASPAAASPAAASRKGR